MHGVVFPGERAVETMTFPDPTPGPGEVVLEMKASGMCGSDLHQYRRPKNVPRTGSGIPASADPVIAGHEPCGVVVAVGAGGDKPPNRKVTSGLVSSGIVDRQLQVIPPSAETKTTDILRPIGSGNRAEAAICNASAGSTVRFGSQFMLVSPLSDSGIMSTTVTERAPCARSIPVSRIPQTVTACRPNCHPQTRRL